MEQIGHDDLARFIVSATADVFSTMLGIEIEPGEPYQKSEMPEACDGVISFIGLAGTWMGTGSIACTAAFACKISSQLLMAEYSAVDEEVLDAVAEVTNMVVGNVKTLIEEILGPLGLSIPTVIFGRNFTSRSAGTNAWTVVPFLADGVRFQVQVCLAPNKGNNRAKQTAGSEMVSL